MHSIPEIDITHSAAMQTHPITQSADIAAWALIAMALFLLIGIAIAAWVCFRIITRGVSWRGFLASVVGFFVILPVASVLLIVAVLIPIRFIRTHHGNPKVVLGTMPDFQFGHPAKWRNDDVRVTFNASGVHVQRNAAAGREQSSPAVARLEPSPPDLPALPLPLLTPPSVVASVPANSTVPTAVAAESAPAHEIETATDAADKPASSLPAWVNEQPSHEQPSQSSDRRLVVVSSRIEGTIEAAETEARLLAVELVRNDFRSHYPESQDWFPPATLVRSTAIRRSHVESIDKKTVSTDTSFRVYRAHCQVELSPAVRATLYPAWRNTLVDQRLWAVGGGAGLLMLTFSTLAAYFRLDDRTAGQYRWRLKLAAVSIIAAGGLAAALCV